MKRAVLVFSLTAMLGLLLWQVFSPERNFYLISVIILFLSMMPFFALFERKKTSARELTLIASLIAIAVVSRAVFYLVPQVKPIGAVVVVSAVCLGAQRGYLIGAFSAFISNFIFGQGIWTPFQMTALGFVGLISGLIFSKIKPTKINLAIIGFILNFVLYGLIVDLSSVVFLAAEKNWQALLAVYSAGIPFNLIYGIATGIFLFLFGVPFIKKINRINTKYGISSD